MQAAYPYPKWGYRYVGTPSSKGDALNWGTVLT